MTLPDQQQLKPLADSLSQCLCRDVFHLQRQLNSLQRRVSSGKPSDRLYQQLSAAIEKSMAQVEQRKKLIPIIDYPQGLPIADKREQIKALIAQHQVVVIAGETGSGKTTQLPKICLELGRGIKGLIGHTQPRRIAARTVANRIAQELHDKLGNKVGYQVRFNNQSSDNTLIKLMTDGILLAEIQRDKYLRRYDTIIIDEAHERSLNIDFLMGYLKNLLPKRPDLKVIITSATIDVDKFAKHFNNAPALEVSGRTFPVEVHYRESMDDQDLPRQIADTLSDIFTQPKRGDVLVFLSGEREIREVAGHLRKCQFPHLEVVPLYARLSLAEQTRVFQPHKGTRVVLATNVAETSLTVPGIRYVIDPGFCRISRYSYRTKVQRLPIEAISQASANQRKGRCGRISEGVCYRLYSEQDFASRPEFTDPEIIRTNLASVILQMLQLNIGDIRDFPFVDKPDNRLINDGFNLLQEVGAVDHKDVLTPKGKLISAFPLDPRLSAMLIAAAKTGVLNELLIIVTALSIQDPRDRPADKQQAADEKHRQWQDKESDFVTLLNIWQYFEQQRQELSRNQFEKHCRKNFISPLRIREWRDLHHQVHSICRELKLKNTGSSGSYEVIHKAILSGFLTQIGHLEEGREFVGTRNRKFILFPASALAKKPPKWVVSGEMIETSKLFAHFNAKIDPQWLPDLAAHLVKKSWSEPHYSVKQGQVVAHEKQTLLGLPIVHKKTVPYGKIDPKVSRDIFIRAALVEGLYRGKGDFFKHNQNLVKGLQGLESKFRRADILVDDEVIGSFYQQRIPEPVINLAGFEKWRKDIGGSKPKLLYLTQAQLVANMPSTDAQAQFPDHISWDGIDYKVSYHFEPGSNRDGVSVTIPVSLLHQIPRYRFEWLVPGLLREKLIALIKGLPKSLRRNFVPVPDYADKVLLGLKVGDTSLVNALAHQLKRHTAIDIPDDAWQLATLDNYYKINFILIDDKDKQLVMSRDLSALQLEYEDAFKESVSQPSGSNIEQDNLQGWSFGELPKLLVMQKNDLSIRTYPALVNEGADGGAKVALRLIDNPYKADYLNAGGLLMLARKAYPKPGKYLGKKLLVKSDLKLKAAGLASKEQWIEGIIQAAYQALFANDPVPRDKKSFELIVEINTPLIIPKASEFESQLTRWLDDLIKIRQLLRDVKPNAAHAVPSIETQLSLLCYPKVFVESTEQQLAQIHRYLAAIIIRLDKLPGQVLKDKNLTVELEELSSRVKQLPKPELRSNQLIEAVNTYTFMIEQYRISLFAQQLKTVIPVSAPRLEKQWQRIEKLLRV